VLTPAVWVADVIGAGISVVTRKGDIALALPLDAAVDKRAAVTVITRRGVGRVDTPIGRVAGVIGADVDVVADDGLGGDAIASLADVSDGARVLVVAWRGVRRVVTAYAAIAGVIGAGVLVIAVQDGLADALTA